MIHQHTYKKNCPACAKRHPLAGPPCYAPGGSSDGTLKPIRKPARDPLIIQMEKAYRKSRQFQLDKLMRKQTVYRRRLTLAQNGLEQVQRDIYEFLHGLAKSRLSEVSREEGEE